MKVNFLMPCSAWAPSGGFRVVYEYANRLTARGHQVSIIHPRRLKFPPPERFTLRHRIRRAAYRVWELVARPDIRWHVIDRRVNLLYVPDSGDSHLPDAEVLFATAWHTVRSVLECSPEKGAKCHLIQGYETWQGPKDLVDATWRAPLRRVVVSKWLSEVGHELGSHEMVYIPNGIDHDRYHLCHPIESRPPQVVMMFSTASTKASRDGIKALEIARQKSPNLRVVLFGLPRRPTWLPNWMAYYRNPTQQFIVEELFNRSGMVLSSSLSEGFALPPAEAAACGCAVVATDSGGIRDFVEHGVTGLLSAPRDPEALARNLVSVLANTHLRIRLAEAAHARIQHFTWSRSTELMEAFLELAVRGRPSGEARVHEFSASPQMSVVPMEKS